MVNENYPWWIKILDKHGIMTIFSLALLWAAYQLSERHFKFIDAQVLQSELQTRALDAIERNTGTNAELLRQLNNVMLQQHNERRVEHSQIMEKLK